MKCLSHIIQSEFFLKQTIHNILDYEWHRCFVLSTFTVFKSWIFILSCIHFRENMKLWWTLKKTLLTVWNTSWPMQVESQHTSYITGNWESRNDFTAGDPVNTLFCIHLVPSVQAVFLFFGVLISAEGNTIQMTNYKAVASLRVQQSPSLYQHFLTSLRTQRLSSFMMLCL